MSALRIPNPLESAAIARPDHPLLVGDRVWTGAELWAGVQARAARLDMGPGDVVPLPVRRDDAWIVELHAVGLRNAAVAPVDSAAPWTQPDAPLPTIESDPGWWPLDEVRLVMQTSGTSGAPTAVPLTTAQLLFGALGSALRLGHLPDDRWLHCLPLRHVGGLAILFRGLFQGITVELAPCFDAEVVARRLASGEVNLVSLTPAMLRSVLDVSVPNVDVVHIGHQRANVDAVDIGCDRANVNAVNMGRDGTDVDVVNIGCQGANVDVVNIGCQGANVDVVNIWPDALRVVLVGGAAMDDGLRARCAALGVPVAETWGMTEAGSQVCTHPPGGFGPIPPLAFARVREARGVLAVDGPLVGGALRTRDRGRVDAGRVVVTGRADDVIISGGLNLAPEPIEAVLRAHPAVDDVAVVGVPDARWGARPVAVLVGRPVAGLDGWCRARLRPYACPDAFVWRESLGRDALGKLSRRRVAEQLDIAHAGDEGRRDAARLEGGERHERVLEAHGAAQVVGVVGAGDPIGVGDRALAEPLDLRADRERVAVADGSAVAGLGVHERHAEAVALEDARDLAERRGEQLLEADVRVLEGAAEEHDADAVHFVEAGGEDVLEGHRARLRENQG